MKNKVRQFDQFDVDYEEEEFRPNKKKDSPRRRPVRNWKREWDMKSDKFDEIDDFHSK